MKNWTELENSSFFDANARERALGMVDKGTFTEFLNPLDRYCSPHLPVLGTAVEFDDGTVCGVGLLGKHPVFVVSMGNLLAALLARSMAVKWSQLFAWH